MIVDERQPSFGRRKHGGMTSSEDPALATVGPNGVTAAGGVPGQPLPAALLYRPCDPGELRFELVSELEDPPGPIGQDRAVEALEFGVAMRRKGYSIYALGPSGTGKHTVIEDLLRRRATGMPAPPDWCYVNNFIDPQKPRRLQLPPGRAVGLRNGMKRLVEELRVALPAAFERDDYRARRDVIEQQFRGRSDEGFGELQRRAEQRSITLMRTPMGLALAPRRDGKVFTPEMFEALPAAEREQIQHDLEEVQGELEAVMQKVPQWEREHREAVRELKRDTKEKADDFLPSAQPAQGMPMPAPVEEAVAEGRFRRYQVNVLVDNSTQ